jgi:hypothetical protein
MAQRFVGGVPLSVVCITTSRCVVRFISQLHLEGGSCNSNEVLPTEVCRYSVYFLLQLSNRCFHCVLEPLLLAIVMTSCKGCRMCLLWLRVFVSPTSITNHHDQHSMMSLHVITCYFHMLLVTGLAAATDQRNWRFSTRGCVMAVLLRLCGAVSEASATQITLIVAPACYNMSFSVVTCYRGGSCG